MVNKSLKRGKPLWEEMCSEIKLKEFREEIEHWGEEAGRLLDKKDEKIDVLMKVLEESHELQERNFSKYIDQFDYLTGAEHSGKEISFFNYILLRMSSHISRRSHSCL